MDAGSVVTEPAPGPRGLSPVSANALHPTVSWPKLPAHFEQLQLPPGMGGVHPRWHRRARCAPGPRGAIIQPAAGPGGWDCPPFSEDQGGPGLGVITHRVPESGCAQRQELEKQER